MEFTTDLLIFKQHIRRETSYKFLRIYVYEYIYIDEGLTWKVDGRLVLGNLSRAIGLMSKIEDLVPLSALK